MPKMKTHSGAKKRIKVTGTGKITHRREGASHFLMRKSKSRKRKFSHDHQMNKVNSKKMNTLLRNR